MTNHFACFSSLVLNRILLPPTLFSTSPLVAHSLHGIITIPSLYKRKYVSPEQLQTVRVAKRQQKIRPQTSLNYAIVNEINKTKNVTVRKLLNKLLLEGNVAME